MRASIKRMGNSAAVLLPKTVVAHLGVTIGDELDLDMVEGKVTLARIERHPREGWADAAKGLADAEDDGAAWPYFPNEGDDAL